MKSYGLVVLIISVVGITCLPTREGRFHYAESRDNYIDDTQEFQHKPSERELNDAFSSLPANGDRFEGDIIMDNRLRRAVLGQNSKKSAITSKGIKWPGGILYYEIADDFVAGDLLKDAMREFTSRTCIRFVKRPKDQPNYVEYTSDLNICASNIGRVLGKQKITVGKNCKVLGTVLHETMHALGFVHEHSRYDRDNHVDIKWDNIKKAEWSNFQTYKMDHLDNLDVPYNFASVMHYRNDAFTKNGDNTIVAIGEPYLKFGQRIKFSVGDVKEINRLYNCKVPQDYQGLFRDYSGITSDEKKKKKEEHEKQKLRKWLHSFV